MDWEVTAGFMPNGGYNMNEAQEDLKLLVRFYWEALEVSSNPPKFEDVEFIEIRQIGARDALFEGPVTENHKRRFKSRYDAWKSTRQNPRTGLPLTEWPLITKAKVKELEAAGVYTVEELSNVSDSLLPRIGLFASQVRQKARDWLEQGKSGAVLGTLRTENENLKTELEHYKQRISYLEEQIKEVQKHPLPQAIPSTMDLAGLVQEQVRKALHAFTTESDQPEVIKEPKKNRKTITLDDDNKGD